MMLTDAGKFSYTCLCATVLPQLYTSKHDESFKNQFMKTLMKHLDQGAGVETTVYATLQGHGTNNAEPFVDTLMLEPILQNDGSLIIQDILSLGLRDGYYDSRLRAFVKHLALLMRVDWEKVEQHEESIVTSLKEEEHCQSEEEKQERRSLEKKRKRKRYFLIGLATVGGGTLIGLTGGLAAPLVAAGAGAIIGGAGAAALGSTAGIAIIGSLFGVAGAGLTGFKMKKRVGAVEQFEFQALSESNQLHIAIVVSGWVLDEYTDFHTPWAKLDVSKEQYTLVWESKYLLDLGKALDYLVHFAVSAATQEVLQYTLLSGIMAAITWPVALLSVSSIIDNPWSVCIKRSAEAGAQLAEVLLSRQHGKRPVTLIGFSLGARVIFYCLKEMCKRKNCEGVIEDVVLLGTPVSGNPKEWEPLSRVVAGKIVNGYCRSDWLLKFLYRTANIQFSIAGLGPVNWNDRRMHNIDLSDVVEGHMDYRNKIDYILRVVGIRVKEDSSEVVTADLASETESGISMSYSHDSLRTGSEKSGVSRAASEDSVRESTSPSVGCVAAKESQNQNSITEAKPELGTHVEEAEVPFCERRDSVIEVTTTTKILQESISKTENESGTEKKVAQEPVSSQRDTDAQIEACDSRREISSSMSAPELGSEVTGCTLSESGENVNRSIFSQSGASIGILKGNENSDTENAQQLRSRNGLENDISSAGIHVDLQSPTTPSGEDLGNDNQPLRRTSDSPLEKTEKKFHNLNITQRQMKTSTSHTERIGKLFSSSVKDGEVAKGSKDVSNEAVPIESKEAHSQPPTGSGASSPGH